MTTYDSDVTEDQFNLIKPILESVKKRTKPRTLNLHHILNAVLYTLKTGCQWRSLPKTYPDYRRVHSYFTSWKESGVLDEVLKKIDCQGKTKTQQK